MTSSPTRSVDLNEPELADRLPWPSLLVLGAATLLMVTTEMLPTAVLVPMSVGLGVGEARTAQLVSLWAAVVVVASFPLVRLTRRFDRRNVIAAGLLVLAGSSVATALAPTYEVAISARLLGAAGVGLLWSTVNAHVADLVSSRLLGTAVAVVLGGATLGLVIGTPVARLVAERVGWRGAFIAAGIAAVMVAVAVRLVVRVADRRTATSPSPTSDRESRQALGPMTVTALLVGLALVGHYGAYTFITRLAEEPAEVLPGGISAALLLFGLASAVGVVLAGQVRTATTPALVVAALLTAAAVGALTWVTAAPVLSLVVIAGWGMASGALPVLAQTAILRQAGTAHRTTAGALIPVVFNGGIAVGAVLAALVVDDRGLAALPPVAAAVVVLAAVGLAAVPARRPRRT